jgi:hypothetical protein
MPQLSYNAQPALRLGEIATTQPWHIESKGNELLAQITEATLAASADGIYTLTITDPTGQIVVTSTFTASTSTEDDIIVDLIADLEADPNFNNIATASNDDPVLTLTFLHTGLVYTVATTSTGSGFTVANTQDAGGTAIGLGLAVTRGSGDTLAVAPTADTDVMIGITTRNTLVEVNSGIRTDVTEYEPGSKMSVMSSGVCAVQTEGAVTQGGAVFARHDVGATAFALGQLSATDDAETVAVPNAVWDTSTTAAGLARVKVNLPG